MSSSRGSLVPFIAVCLIGSVSWVVAKAKGSQYEREFRSQCEAKYAAETCDAIEETYHSICEERATPRRHRRQITSDAPDRQKYLSCMMREARSRAYVERNLGKKRPDPRPTSTLSESSFGR
jgi:hypothetical protein